AQVAPDRAVYFREPKLWERYRLQVIFAALASVVQSLLLAYVLLQSRKRRAAENSLRESEERMSFTAASANVGLWQLDRRTGQLWATEHCRVLFGLRDD